MIGRSGWTARHRRDGTCRASRPRDGFCFSVDNTIRPGSNQSGLGADECLNKTGGKQDKDLAQQSGILRQEKDQARRQSFS